MNSCCCMGLALSLNPLTHSERAFAYGYTHSATGMRIEVLTLRNRLFCGLMRSSVDERPVAWPEYKLMLRQFLVNTGMSKFDAKAAEDGFQERVAAIPLPTYLANRCGSKGKQRRSWKSYYQVNGRWEQQVKRLAENICEGLQLLNSTSIAA